ncbi:MAG: hypothetical protein HZA51_12265 [Planctomycetes bacterium]|nr:hypothetical protein [Planctomycetota bacterium]
MTGLRLIVETPRGGEAGHRFLISRNDTVESEVALAAAAASQNAVGRSYISVSRQVTQRLPNGAVREGAERMILGGVDVGALQPEQIEQVKSELTKLLPSLDSLIESMNWSSGNRSTVIVCEELRDWVASELFGDLPLSELTVASSSTKSGPPIRSPTKWLLIATLALACVGMLWLFSGRRVSRTESGKTQKQPLLLTNEARVRELASEWQCTPEEVIRSLKRAGNWDRRREADGLSLKTGLEDGEILAMLNKVAASNGSDRYCVSPSIEGAVAFRGFVGDRPLRSAEEIRRLRRWLFSTWMQYADLRQAAKKARDALNQEGARDVFSRMLVSVADAETEVGLGDSFQDPATPLLDRQDLMIFRLLEDIRQGLSMGGFTWDSAEGSIDVVTTDSLTKFVTDLRVHLAGMRDAIKKSRAILTDTVRENKGSGIADAVFDAYKSLERFLEELSKNPNR